ncbi:MAG: hypothetical protein E7384_04480 [Ruminococcaceae bacterium]|nr:hypothetical protein [Oscillospiraceae bacterium]
MGLFKNTTDANTVVQLTQRDLLEAKYKNSRLNLLLVVVFTVINMIMLFLDSSSYFLFSASVPYFMTYFGLYFGGKFPAEMYADVVPEGHEFIGYGNGVVIVLTVIAALIVATYLLCWIFSNKKRVGWLIAALVMFSIDTVAMFFLSGFAIENILDIVFHVWVIIDLSRGISAYFKLKKLPAEEISVAEDGVVSEVVSDEVSELQPEAQDEDTAPVAEIAENSAKNSVEVSNDANFI